MTVERLVITTYGLFNDEDVTTHYKPDAFAGWQENNRNNIRSMLDVAAEGNPQDLVSAVKAAANARSASDTLQLLMGEPTLLKERVEEPTGGQKELRYCDVPLYDGNDPTVLKRAYFDAGGRRHVSHTSDPHNRCYFAEPGDSLAGLIARNPCWLEREEKLIALREKCGLCCW
jgi:hypothetical protein